MLLNASLLARVGPHSESKASTQGEKIERQERVERVSNKLKLSYLKILATCTYTEFYTHFLE